MVRVRSLDETGHFEGRLGMKSDTLKSKTALCPLVLYVARLLFSNMAFFGKAMGKSASSEPSARRCKARMT